MKSYAIENLTQFFSYSRTSLCCGIIIICCRWIVHDSHVRRDYQQAIGDAVDDILEQIRTGRMPPEMAAQKAHQMRNRLFYSMRHRTSPIGLIVAHAIHATARPYEYFLEKNTLLMFGKPSKELSQRQAEEVVMKTINSARRPSNAVTGISHRASLFCKGIIISIATASFYSALISEHRLVDIARLIALGSCSAAVGNLGMVSFFIYMSWRSARGRETEIYNTFF
ncbi:hypothetical protein CCMA1212_007566 [Trichoderma ghanense]|uniref:Uncharacterized protein n=1 Tax=Trichoderma ghanense TaxID=65468 RepID=A0ABY2GWV5_9HYPO